MDNGWWIDWIWICCSGGSRIGGVGSVWIHLAGRWCDSATARWRCMRRLTTACSSSATSFKRTRRCFIKARHRIRMKRPIPAVSHHPASWIRWRLTANPANPTNPATGSDPTIPPISRDSPIHPPMSSLQFTTRRTMASIRLIPSIRRRITPAVGASRSSGIQWNAGTIPAGTIPASLTTNPAQRTIIISISFAIMAVMVRTLPLITTFNDSAIVGSRSSVAEPSIIAHIHYEPFDRQIDFELTRVICDISFPAVSSHVTNVKWRCSRSDNVNPIND